MKRSLIALVTVSQVIPVLLFAVPAEKQPSRAAEADFNVDGKSNLVWRNQRTGENGVVYGRCNGPVEGASRLSSTWSGAWHAADFNGDGKPDVLWRNFWTGKNGVWLMDGTPIVTTSIVCPQWGDPNWRLTANPFTRTDGKPGFVSAILSDTEAYILHLLQRSDPAVLAGIEQKQAEILRAAFGIPVRHDRVFSIGCQPVIDKVVFTGSVGMHGRSVPGMRDGNKIDYGSQSQALHSP
jgi:hypothetical protein